MLKLKLQQLIFYEKLIKSKNELEKTLEEMPKGWLVVHKRKNGYTELYHHTYDARVRKQKYLSLTKDAELIKELSKKEENSDAIKTQIKDIKSLINKLKSVIEYIVSTTTLPEDDYPPQTSQNPYRREDLIWTTNRKEKVRSKSEKIIADTLYKLKLDYAYEKALQLNGRTYYPDFTIFNPLNGQIYFWEHLGLGTEEYLEKWEKRKLFYEKNNIVQGKSLITTVEDDINHVEEIADNIFTLIKYINLK